jgi:hypothetical protein
MRLRRRLPFHMSAGAVGRSRTQMAAVPTKLSVSNWIGLHVIWHTICHYTATGCHESSRAFRLGCPTSHLLK